MKRQIAVTVLLVASVVINVVLAHRLAEFNRLVATTRIEPLKRGIAVPPLRALDVAGREKTLKYDEVSTPTVLYILKPSCSWCTRNMDNLNVLLDNQRGHYRFVGVSLSQEALAEYVAKNDLKLPVYSGLSPGTLATYKLGSTPQTIVISPEGKVLQDWIGAYVGNQKSQVEAFFHVTLPGLRELPKAEAAAKN